MIIGASCFDISLNVRSRRARTLRSNHPNAAAATKISVVSRLVSGEVRGSAVAGFGERKKGEPVKISRKDLMAAIAISAVLLLTLA
jgi:hypothetical protein